MQGHKEAYIHFSKTVGTHINSVPNPARRRCVKDQAVLNQTQTPKALLSIHSFILKHKCQAQAPVIWVNTFWNICLAKYEATCFLLITVFN